MRKNTLEALFNSVVIGVDGGVGGNHTGKSPGTKIKAVVEILHQSEKLLLVLKLTQVIFDKYYVILPMPYAVRTEDKIRIIYLFSH